MYEVLRYWCARLSKREEEIEERYRQRKYGAHVGGASSPNAAKSDVLSALVAIQELNTGVVCYFYATGSGLLRVLRA
jgi:hypothetical protein